jgi:predicted  nucleic acid-binding Zn-ribbon protein
MKLLNVMLVGALTMVMVACGGSAKDQLVGKWQVTDVDMSAMMETIPEEQKAFMESMLPMMEEAMKSMTMEFTADGKVKQVSAMMGETQEEEGTWSLSDDAKTLTINTKGNDESMNLTELSSSKMVVSIEEEDASFSMTFEKQ